MGTDPWGVDDGWAGNDGRWHAAPPATLAAIGEAMGRSTDAPPPDRGTLIHRPGATHRLADRASLVLEDGTVAGEMDELPPDLPLGLHELTSMRDGTVSTLIVSPGRCHLPPDLRAWGVAIQVPTTRSRSGWGIGDLADVRLIADWLDGLGAGALALSPLHAPTPVPPIQTSPYYPSSRRWRSPLLIRVDQVPTARSLPEIASLAGEARAAAARAGSTVDRDAVWQRQRAALELIWAQLPAAALEDLAQWRSAQGVALECWARFCCLADEHGPGWANWPVALRHPDNPAVAQAAAREPDRIAFHAWLQLLVDQQLQQANVGGVRLIQDLAVGVDPGGADAWMEQDLLALDMSVGAPPDDFAPEGQSWGLPPYDPWRLRAAGYRPFAELLRASLAQGGGLRVDHVMALSRLFWIPRGASPADGTYVRYPARDLLEVLALESERAQALVIGEDLGTVEAGFRHALHEAGVLTTRLVWFEEDPPHRYPRQALAMVTTHDLPTIAGFWTGADEVELAALGRPTPGDQRDALRHRLDALVGLPADATPSDAIDSVLSHLGRSAASLSLTTLEDLCERTQRPNVPGTLSERPNWSQVLPTATEDLPADATVAGHLARLAAARRD